MYKIKMPIGNDITKITFMFEINLINKMDLIQTRTKSKTHHYQTFMKIVTFEIDKAYVQVKTLKTLQHTFFHLSLLFIFKNNLCSKTIMIKM